MKLVLITLYYFFSTISADKEEFECREYYHEEYSQCDAHCDLNCRFVDDNGEIDTSSCARDICNEGCRCKEGYVRLVEKKGPCIPADVCNKMDCDNRPWEIFSACDAGECISHCSQLVGDMIMCDQAMHCVSGCKCRDGYYKNKDDECVRTSDCALEVCGMNEKLVKCDGNYMEEICRSTGKDKESNFCTKGYYDCACKDGYARDLISGECWPREKCPSECKVEFNEVWSECDSHCNPTCDEPNPICTEQCNPGCKCAPGMVKHGKWCIEESQCKNTNCGNRPNEIFSACYAHDCGTRTCEDMVGHMFMCMIYGCHTGCICERGFHRNENDECVDYEGCAIDVCGDNEIFVNCEFDMGEKYCEGNGDGVPVPADVKPCENTHAACRCARGYARNDAGDCVVFNDSCSNYMPNTCSDMENKEWSDCNSGCQPTCMDITENGDIDTIMCPAICLPGCKCKEGYVATKEGNCIRPEMCEDYMTRCEDKPNEEFQECYSTCGSESCDSLTEPPIMCITQGCGMGCRCKRGYSRNDKGVCIPSEECNVCGMWEHLVDCMTDPVDNCCKNKKVYDYERKGDYDNNDNNTNNYDNYVNKKEDKCKTGQSHVCHCTKGYSRDSENKCIHDSDCQYNECPYNEWYDYCNSHHERSCEHLDKYGHYEDMMYTTVCIAGCRCKEGLYRNDKGKCVEKDKCPAMCNDAWNTEYSECNAHCNPGCDDFNDDGTVREDFVCTKQCTCGCKCKEGYAKLETGECIPWGQCKNRECGGRPNEVFSPCRSMSCGMDTCASLIGPPIMCDMLWGCSTGCQCYPGYYKNENNVCVSLKSCTKQVCEPGEILQNCYHFKNEDKIESFCSPLNSINPVSVVKPEMKCHGNSLWACVCPTGMGRDSDGNCRKLKTDCAEFNCDVKNLKLPKKLKIQCDKSDGHLKPVQEYKFNKQRVKYCVQDITSNLGAIPGTQLPTKEWDDRFDCKELATKWSEAGCLTLKHSEKNCYKKGYCNVCLPVLKDGAFEILHINNGPKWKQHKKKPKKTKCIGLDGKVIKGMTNCQDCKRYALKDLRVEDNEHLKDLIESLNRC